MAELKVGDVVVAKDGTLDEDDGTSVAGWVGRIGEFADDGKLVYIEWDSKTIEALSDEFILKALGQHLDFSGMYLKLSEVEATAARDKEKDVHNILQQIYAKHSYAENSGKVSDDNRVTM